MCSCGIGIESRASLCIGSAHLSPLLNPAMCINYKIMDEAGFLLMLLIYKSPLKVPECIILLDLLLGFCRTQLCHSGHFQNALLIASKYL